MTPKTNGVGSLPDSKTENEGRRAARLGEMQCRLGVIANGNARQSLFKVVQHSDKVCQDLRPARRSAPFSVMGVTNGQALK
jgi:hypothetical protein